MTRIETLSAALQAAFGDRVEIAERFGEITLTVKSSDLAEVARRLRDDASLGFDTLIDLCGVDYLNYGDGAWSGLRFASVMHLLSVSLNWRLRVRTFCPDDDFPMVPSVVDVWPAVGWFERGDSL